MRGACPITDIYISENCSGASLPVRLNLLPSSTPVISATISPKRGSAMYFRRNRRIGSRRTSSRPARAIRSPSRWTNSWIKANAVVGGTFYSWMNGNLQSQEQTWSSPSLVHNQGQQNTWNSSEICHTPWVSWMSACVNEVPQDPWICYLQSSSDWYQRTYWERQEVGVDSHPWHLYAGQTTFHQTCLLKYGYRRARN